MKKRFISLLFVSLFALSGCASEITPDKAEEVVEDLKSYKYNVNSISELKVQSKLSLHLDGTLERQLNDNRQDRSYLIELSSKFNYIHIKSKTSNKDKVEDTDSLQENETWIYMRNKVLYRVYRTKSKGREQKSYSTVEKYSSAIKEFSDAFDYSAAQACSEARGSAFLDSSIVSQYVDNLDNYEVEYGAKFYSSGLGNLRIVGAAKCEEYKYSGIPAKVIGALSCNWDKYFVKNATLGITVNISDGTNKSDCKYTVALSEKVSKLIIPTYPGLSSYAKN